MKFHRPIGLALAIAMAMIAAAGCLPNMGQKPLEIVTPKNGNSTTATDFQIEIRTAVNPTSVAITINTKSIASSNFTITANNTGATVKGKVPTADLKPNAYNTLKVTAKDNGGQSLSDEISFIFGQAPGGPGNPPPGGGPTDTTAPTLTVTGPVRGQYVGLGATLSVVGTATDNVRVANLYVTVDRASPTNETTYLNPTDGTFKVDVTFAKAGLHRLKVRATDAAGNETTNSVSIYAGTAAQSGTKATKGAEVSVSSGGMTKVGNIIETFINPPALDVDTLAKSFNPVWSGSAGPASATINITRATFSHADLDLKTVAGGVDTKAQVDDFLLAVKADVKIFF
ncbi:MAG: Ig-like domain-containing protein, partial [Actinomycetota bacterium]